MTLDERIKYEQDQVQDIYNTLGLIYSEQTHDAFREALERFLDDTFECKVVDLTEFRYYEIATVDAEEYRHKSVSLEMECTELRDRLHDFAERSRALANQYEP